MTEIIRCPQKNALEIETDGKQYGTYVATVPVAHSMDAVLSPEYFGQMQTRGPNDRLLRVGDHIKVRPEDFSWYVELMVRACQPSVDKVVTAALVGPVVFGAGELPDGWAVEYKGRDALWTVSYLGSEKAARFRTPEEAAAKVAELSGFDPAPVRGKPGRKPRAPQPEPSPAKEPEAV